VLGGADTLDMAPDAAREAMAELGEKVGLSPEETALGILRVANATMERALRRVSVEQGHDPRDYTLVPFGGAGPLHAVALAEALDMRRVLVPPTPGVLSALGLLMADVVYDTARAVLNPATDMIDDPSPLADAADAAATDVRTTLSDHGSPQLALELDLRYEGQSYEISVPLDTPLTGAAVEAAVQAFHERHRERYGHADPEEPVEIVVLRVRGRVETPPVDLPREPETDRPLDAAVLGERPVWFDATEPTLTTAYDRTELHHGHTLDGPAILHQYDTTIVVPPGWHARVDAWQNVWIER